MGSGSQLHLETAGSPGNHTTHSLTPPLRSSLPLLLQVQPTVLEFPDRHSLLYLPNPFIVPGGRFRETYYWYIYLASSFLDGVGHSVSGRDTYWIVEGLLLCGMNETARGMIENLAHLVDQ